jgi:hypothetical protein
MTCPWRSTQTRSVSQTYAFFSPQESTLRHPFSRNAAQPTTGSSMAATTMIRNPDLTSIAPPGLLDEATRMPGDASVSARANPGVDVQNAAGAAADRMIC